MKFVPYGYKHYLQSVRIVERLEKDGKGLNLTKEVRRRHRLPYHWPRGKDVGGTDRPLRRSDCLYQP